MRKFLILFLILLNLPVLALETPENQIKNAIREEKEQKEKVDTNVQKKDYKKEWESARQSGSKARCRGSVSAGYEHSRSKYQAQKSMSKNKAAFQKRKNFELMLLRGNLPSKDKEKEILKSSDSDADSDN